MNAKKNAQIKFYLEYEIIGNMKWMNKVKHKIIFSVEQIEIIKELSLFVVNYIEA